MFTLPETAARQLHRLLLLWSPLAHALLNGPFLEIPAWGRRGGRGGVSQMWDQVEMGPNFEGIFPTATMVVVITNSSST